MYPTIIIRNLNALFESSVVSENTGRDTFNLWTSRRQKKSTQDYQPEFQGNITCLHFNLTSLQTPMRKRTNKQHLFMSCFVRLKNIEKYGTSTHLGRSSTKVQTFYSTWTSTLQQIEGSLDQFLCTTFSHETETNRQFCTWKWAWSQKETILIPIIPCFRCHCWWFRNPIPSPAFGWCCWTRRK